MTKLTRRKYLHRKLLEIKEAGGRREGLADNYRNLGNFYFTEGTFHRAEEMYRKSLEIGEARGNKKAMADAYIKLGYLYQTRGNLDRAAEMYLKSIELFRKIRRVIQMDEVEVLLDDLRTRR